MEIRVVKNGRDLLDFIKLPWRIYKHDQAWVPPLRSEVKALLGPKHNPYWKHADQKLFIVKKNGKTVGRVAGIIDHLHNEYRKEKAGFFGFFECVHDYGIAELLLSTVRMYLRENQLEIMRGPMNPSINEECGTLIQGFDTPPFLMMTHNPPYYPGFFDRFGFTKAVDWVAYIGPIDAQLPKEITIASRFAQAHNPELRIRPVNLKKLGEDALKIKEIFNSAWSKNWGFVPFTDLEMISLAKRLKPIAVPELALIAEIKGEPVGVLVGAPNFNQVLKHLNGRLSPVGFIKALYYGRKIDSGRLIIMGVKEEYRKSGIEAVLYEKAFTAAYKLGIRTVESSMILENNTLTRKAAELSGGKAYKVYRIYETRI